jgi:hypothetical protein
MIAMGRTLPTSTQLIRECEDAWRPYLRALREEDREVLLELLAMMRAQSAPIAYAAPPDPFQLFALTMLGGILKRLIHLEQMVAAQNAHQLNGSTECDD